MRGIKSLDGTEESVEASLEIALEIRAVRIRPRTGVSPALLQATHKITEVHLNDADGAVGIEHSDDDVFPAARLALSHVQLSLAAAVVQLPEGLALELPAELARGSVDGRCERADGHHVVRAGETVLRDDFTRREQQHSGLQAGVLDEAAERRFGPALR